ncbi:MAG: alkaline phosphatase family protein [Planctomycetaceae bacterium]
MRSPALYNCLASHRSRQTNGWKAIVGLWLLVTLPWSCAPSGHTPLILSGEDSMAPDAILVPGHIPWTDTGVEVQAGQPVTITAQGQIHVGKLPETNDGSERSVGPEGTFLYSNELHGRNFPLPAAGSGPAPCFCLIARIGAGTPFFVGQACSLRAPASGRLYLGINDYDPFGNQGGFLAQISQPNDVQPLQHRLAVPAGLEEGGPVPGCDVVVFYVDGLRPDIVEELAAMGHVPHLRRHFVEGGTHLCNAFTAFPSDTITSNGTMWTGCFSDRHGLKGQVRFSRHRRNSDSFLEPMGPGRSSRQLGTRGVDRVLHEAQAATVRTLQGSGAETYWRGTRCSETPAVYDHLQSDGDDWATGVLPIMTQTPPLMWTRSMARVLPYLQSHQAWRYIDDANTHYALRHLISQRRRVTVIWLPETDSVSHKECRGQFGSTRRTIVKADQLVGEVTAALEAQGRLNSTYLVLVSDHGHLGGQISHLSRFDLANEVFFHPREVTRDGQWIGGGLGLSVRQHRFQNFHPGDDTLQFAFIDGDSDGAARIFLPRGGYHSGNWTGPNTAAQLLAYPIADHLPPVNLPEHLAGLTARHDDGTIRHPLDLILLKLSAEAILITTADRGQAVIDRRRDAAGRWLYRYTPVEGVRPTSDGRVEFQVAAAPKTDPLGLLQRVRPAFLRQFHDEQTWLYVTANSQYPDAVVTLSRHMLWQESILDQEQEYAPDLVVTARHGWLIGTQNTPGTTHGYPLAESVRATWYVSGPNIRRGARAQAPCRLADLTPTLLALTSTPYPVESLDGRPLQNIYEAGAAAELVTRISATGPTPPQARLTPRYWRDVDLQAWQSLDYRPVDVYGGMPKSINDANNPWDLNNLAYNAMSIGDWSVFRLADDAASAITPGQTDVTSRLERIEQGLPQKTPRPWMGEGVRALDLPGLALSDYSMTSGGNMSRANNTLDWLQGRGESIDRRISSRVNAPTVTGIPLINRGIDGVQNAFWDVYRFGQRVAVELLDEVVLNGIENNVDNLRNTGRNIPAEVLVEPPAE